VPDKDYSQIPVGGPHTKRRGVALVDAEDAEAVGAYRWHMQSRGYAARNTWVGGSRLYVLMHRFLLGLAPCDPRQADHVNGDRLDNRRANLRVCVSAQNQQNRLDGPYRGATWDDSRSLWQAYATLGGKRHFLGRFATRDEAATAAAAFRRANMPFSADAREAAA
jgi:hypothetical protein